MKKLLTIILTISIVLTFASCSAKTENEKSTKSTTTTEKATEVVDENLLTVDYTIPASFFNEDSPATDELTQEQKDSGIKSAKVNDDGSVTYTISKANYRKMVKEMKTSTEKGLNEIPKDYPCIKSVKFNDDFSKITLTANEKEYANGFNSFCIMQAGLLATFYQCYTGTKEADLNSVVTVVDENGKTIETGTYPIEK